MTTTRKCFDDDDSDPLVEDAETREDLSDRRGFDPSFLGIQTPAPRFRSEIQGDAVSVDGSTELKYEHFSLAMSWERRMARWVAWNIDGTRLPDERTIPRRGFRLDHRLDSDRQIGNDAYDQGNRLDRGHVSRRADLLWGTLDEATRANSDSSYYPNITPQMDDFNQSGRGGLWGCLENALYKQVKTGQRISVFGGPILAPDDVPYKDIQVDIQVPGAFWKILVYLDDGDPRAKGFVLKQIVKDIDTERIELPKWAPFEKSVADIADRTSLDFGVIAGWDQTGRGADVEALEKPILDLAAIHW